MENTKTSEPNFSTMSDKDLLKLCQEYGVNCREWRRKFEALLPEVLKRRLYKKHKFISIYEFAAKLCGLSHDSVDNVIRIYDQLEDKPILRSLVVEFGWSKLRIVSGIATKETDASWAEKVRVLPSSSLVTFVRDLKRQEERKGIEKLNNQNTTSPIFGTENLTEKSAIAINTISTCSIAEQGSQKQPLEKQTSLIIDIDQPQINRSVMSFGLSPEVEFRLRKLKARIEKGKKEKISFNRLFEVMLDLVENRERVVKSRGAYSAIPALRTAKAQSEIGVLLR